MSTSVFYVPYTQGASVLPAPLYYRILHPEKSKIVVQHAIDSNYFKLFS